MSKSKKSAHKGALGGWAAKETLVGDRLPYQALVDENVVLLRDGSVMLSLMVPGFAFETADSEELNAHVATREVLLRSSLDARFVLYHHVIRRRVQIALEGQFEDPLAAHIDARWRARTGSGALFVNDQFVTLVRRPARGKAGWLALLAWTLPLLPFSLVFAWLLLRLPESIVVIAVAFTLMMLLWTAAMTFWIASRSEMVDLRAGSKPERSSRKPRS